MSCVIFAQTALFKFFRSSCTCLYTADVKIFAPCLNKKLLAQAFVKDL